MDLCLMADVGSWWLDPSNWLAIAMMVIGIGSLIFVHEAGHFLVAKACGVKCEKFYVGFDFFDIKIAGRVIVPRSLVRFQWGETEYGIGIIPLGGYVKMLGMDDNPAKAAEEAEKVKIREGQPQQGDEAKTAEPAKSNAASADSGISVKEAIRHPDTSASRPAPQTENGEKYQLDPRSYQAKPVYQRMAIISAGVIMNLIFAWIFASIAYGFGVQNVSCEIGGIVPASPAYKHGLQPGDKIIQIGRNGKRSEYLRYYHDLLEAVVINGGQHDMELFIRHKDGREEWIKIRPSNDFTKDYDLATLGVMPVATTKLSKRLPVFEHTPAGQAEPPFQGGDVVVAINGSKIADYYELKTFLAQHPDEKLTFTVERSNGKSEDGRALTEEAKVVVDRNPLKRLGLVMETGPIKAIEPGTPAEKAGFKEGDVLVSLNNEPIGDPLLLSQKLLPLAREQKQVVIGVRRAGAKEPVKLDVTPRLPTVSHADYGSDVAMLCDELGIAYAILNRVQGIAEDAPNDGAAKHFQQGDLLLKARFVVTDEKAKQKALELGQSDKEMMLGTDYLSWPMINSRLQMSVPKTQVEITYQRKGKELTATIAPYTSEEYVNPNRGFVLTKYEPVHQAESVGEAISLGLRETKESVMKVFNFLHKLITGQISVTNMGGPASIVVLATSEASEGPSRLLIFLTLLSANLAVINFLPIPVLDGGHMLFLTYEAIFRRPLSEKWFFRLSYAGLAFILCLMLFVFSLDIWRIAGWLGMG